MPRISSSEYAFSIESYTELTMYSLFCVAAIVYFAFQLYDEQTSKGEDKFRFKLYYSSGFFWFPFIIGIIFTQAVINALHRLSGFSVLYDLNLLIRFICALLISYLFFMTMVFVAHIYKVVKRKVDMNET
jgi:hypothetical protein